MVCRGGSAPLPWLGDRAGDIQSRGTALMYLEGQTPVALHRVEPACPGRPPAEPWMQAQGPEASHWEKWLARPLQTGRFLWSLTVPVPGGHSALWWKPAPWQWDPTLAFPGLRQPLLVGEHAPLRDPRCAGGEGHGLSPLQITEGDTTALHRSLPRRPPVPARHATPSCHPAPG